MLLTLPPPAVKCNPDPHLLRFLADLGLGFDCASAAEIQLVLGLGIDPSRIVFSHPCKAVSALQMASSHGVMLAVFDNADELDKIKSVSPGMRLLLRIYAHDDTARVSLGKKFGALPETTLPLLRKARALDLKVVGISFHIGTVTHSPRSPSPLRTPNDQCPPGSAASDPKAFATAARDARRAFDQGKELGFDMAVLDVGGGFQDDNFEAMAPSLQLAVDREFPGQQVRVIAEPGRYYARSYYTLACKVISRRKTAAHNDSSVPPAPDMLYQNDGIYGCFMNRVTEDEVFVPTLIPVDKAHGTPSRHQSKHFYSLWGPTCDSVDCVSDRAALHCEALVGDWLKYPDMGGEYTPALMMRASNPRMHDLLTRRVGSILGGIRDVF